MRNRSHIPVGRPGLLSIRALSISAARMQARAVRHLDMCHLRCVRQSATARLKRLKALMHGQEGPAGSQTIDIFACTQSKQMIKRVKGISGRHWQSIWHHVLGQRSLKHSMHKQHCSAWALPSNLKPSGRWKFLGSTAAVRIRMETLSSLLPRPVTRPCWRKHMRHLHNIETYKGMYCMHL